MFFLVFQKEKFFSIQNLLPWIFFIRIIETG
uniref:Uncharacterized protein n=1 Tax=viral metagenome TaxID=1070528 RepID=A0A6C0K1L4_9ZZZZ